MNHLVHKTTGEIIWSNRDPKKLPKENICHPENPVLKKRGLTLEDCAVHYGTEPFRMVDGVAVDYTLQEKFDLGLFHPGSGLKVAGGMVVPDPNHDPDFERCKSGEISLEHYRSIRRNSLKEDLKTMMYRDYTSPEGRVYQVDERSLGNLLAEILNLALLEMMGNLPATVRWRLADNTKPEIPVEEFRRDYTAAHQAAKTISNLYSDVVHPQLMAATTPEEIRDVSFP